MPKCPERVPKCDRNGCPSVSGISAQVRPEYAGLCASDAQVTLVGVAYRERDGRRLVQFFANSPEAELELLRATCDLLGSFAGTVTDNGVGFDLPFLRSRARMLGLHWPWIETYDLLWTARAWNKRYGQLPDCRLQTVMAQFSLGRKDHTSGNDMVQAYWSWLETHDPAARRVIVKHNADDVLLLPDVANRLLRGRKKVGYGG